MSSVDWYFARGNQQSGPVSAADLKRLAQAGELRLDDLVWREGLSEWVVARNVRGLFDEDSASEVTETAPAPAGEVSTPVEAAPSREPPSTAPRKSRHAVDALLDRLRSSFSDAFVDSTARILRVGGSFGLFVAMLLTLAFAVMVGVKSSAPSSILYGVSFVLILVGLQYAAANACKLLEQLNRKIASPINSALFPNCIAFLSFAAAVSSLLASLAAAMEHSAYGTIVPGVAAFVALAYTGIVALRLAPVNADVAAAQQETISEQAVAVLKFAAKCLASAAPVVFGVGVLFSTLLLACACYEALGSEGLSADAMLLATAAYRGLVLFAALPLVLYLLLLLCGLVCAAVSSRAKPDTPAAGERVK